MTLFDYCACCDSASTELIDGSYTPIAGPTIPCLLCPPCVTQMQAGDVRLKQLLELRLLARRACA